VAEACLKVAIMRDEVVWLNVSLSSPSVHVRVFRAQKATAQRPMLPDPAALHSTIASDKASWSWGGDGQVPRRTTVGVRRRARAGCAHVRLPTLLALAVSPLAWLSFF
jgi:hypothetical protein